MYDQLVLSGGSVNGVAHVGIIRYLQEQGMLCGIKHYFGTSFGSIVCFLAVIGLTAMEMETMMSEFLNEQTKTPYDVDKLLNVTETFGFEDGEDVCKCLRDALERRLGTRNITFIELAKLTGTNLVISGTNLSKQRVDYFNVDTHPNMDVVVAVRISISLPLIFTPMVHEGDVYVDGGLLDHFPYSYCCKHCTLQSMLGIVIDVPYTALQPSDMTLPSYVNAIFECMFKNLNPPPSKFTDNIVHVKCDNTADRDDETFGFDWSTFRFKANATMIQHLACMGYEAIRTFFANDSQVQGPPRSPLALAGC